MFLQIVTRNGKLLLKTHITKHLVVVKNTPNCLSSLASQVRSKQIAQGKLANQNEPSRMEAYH